MLDQYFAEVLLYFDLVEYFECFDNSIQVNTKSFLMFKECQYNKDII